MSGLLQLYVSYSAANSAMGMSICIATLKHLDVISKNVEHRVSHIDRNLQFVGLQGGNSANNMVTLINSQFDIR